MRSAFAVATLGIMLLATAASAEDSDIEHFCTLRFPNIPQYFAWKDCVKTETDRQQERDQKRARDEQARPCIATDIPRMEELASKASKAINSEWSLDEAKAALNPIFGYDGEVDVPNDNIKESVLIYSIRTKCDSSFYLLINVRADEHGKLRWIRTCAQNAPAGYPVRNPADWMHVPANCLEQASIDFDDQRREELRRKQEQFYREKSAKEDQERRQQLEQRHQSALSSIKIGKISHLCMDKTCGSLTFSFEVTNGSSAMIRAVSIGWIFLPPQVTACPAVLQTKTTKNVFLPPNESTWVSIDVTDVPANTARYCLKVSDVDIGLF